MITARFAVDNHKRLVGFHITGHSMTAPHGSDILCAFVSSAAYMAANTVTEIIGADATAEDADGMMKLRLQSEDCIDRCQDILQGLRLHLEATQEQYPKNLKVITMEV